MWLVKKKAVLRAPLAASREPLGWIARSRWGLCPQTGASGPPGGHGQWGRVPECGGSLIDWSRVALGEICEGSCSPVRTVSPIPHKVPLLGGMFLTGGTTGFLRAFWAPSGLSLRRRRETLLYLAWCPWQAGSHLGNWPTCHHPKPPGVWRTGKIAWSVFCVDEPPTDPGHGSPALKAAALKDNQRWKLPGVHHLSSSLVDWYVKCCPLPGKIS